MKCYCCDKEINSGEYSEYQLKKDKSRVYVCFECENTEEYYLDKIKRNCFIDGKSYEVTKKDEKVIEKERALRIKEEEEIRLMDCNKSIFYFTNKQGRVPGIYDNNYQLLRYCNEFLGVKDDLNNDNIQRFTFNSIVNKHWIIPEDWDKTLGRIDIYIDDFKKDTYKSKSHNEKNWNEKTCLWWHGRIVCEEEFYSTTFSFCTENNIFDRVYVDYGFMCSKSYKLETKIKELLIKDGFKKSERSK